MSFLNGTDPGLRQIRAATTDNFAAGVDFTAGSSTQVTLSNDPGSEDNLIVTFDGVTQHRNTYTVSGAVVTFDAAIGSGVSNVEATYTTTIPAATPADNSVTLAKLSDGTQGGLIYYGASGAPTELAAGTSGQFLQTQGAGANPQWATVSGITGTAISETTSGTSVDITGVPSGTIAIDVLWYGYSCSTAAHGPMIQIGNSGGIETTGYDCQGTIGASTVNHTSGFISNHDINGQNAGDDAHLIAHLRRSDTTAHEWLWSSILQRNSVSVGIGMGTKTLSGELDRVRFTTAGGDTLSAGSARLMYW